MAATPGLRSSASCASTRPGAASTSPANVLNNHVAYDCGASGTNVPARQRPRLGPADAPSSAAPWPTRSAAVSTRRFSFNMPTGVNDALYIGGTWSKGATTDVVRQHRPGLDVRPLRRLGQPRSPTAASPAACCLTRSTPRRRARVRASRSGPIGQQLTTGYGGSIAFEHGWNAEWRTSVFGGVQVVDYNDDGQRDPVLEVAAGVLAQRGWCERPQHRPPATGTTASSGVGTRTYWTPVRDLTIGVEFMWTNHHVGHGDGAHPRPADHHQFQAERALRDPRPERVLGLFSVRRFF